ncbi:MAG: hypothetical protein ABJA82_16780, partial [Myxococcales bacterium]
MAAVLAGNSPAPEGAKPVPLKPAGTEGLAPAWLEYFRGARQGPRHPAARDFMNADLRAALGRLVSADARVLEVGSGRGDLIASLPNAVRMGIDML